MASTPGAPSVPRSAAVEQLTASARAGAGIPQDVSPAPNTQDILASLASGRISSEQLMALLSLLSGLGAGGPGAGAEMGGGSPIEAAMMGMGGGDPMAGGGY